MKKNIIYLIETLAMILLLIVGGYTLHKDIKAYEDPDVRYYACVVDKNRAGAKPKLLFKLNLAYNEWFELGHLRMKQKLKWGCRIYAENIFTEKKFF